MHSTAEYCAPVWCRSAHTRLINPTIDNALRIVTADRMSSSYTSRQPSNSRRYPTCWASSQWSHTALARRAIEPGHLLHSALTRPSSAKARRLKSRHPFVTAAQQLISSSDNIGLPDHVKFFQGHFLQWETVSGMKRSGDFGTTVWLYDP